MSTENQTVTEQSFWGRHRLQPEGRARFAIGPLILWVERSKDSWQISGSLAEDRTSPRLELTYPGKEVDFDNESISFRRCLMTGPMEDEIELRPAMADRLLVAFAEDELHVLPGAQAVVYISSPLWLQIWGGERLLFEQAVVRPTDTWFGSSTRQGELAYGVRTPFTTTPEEQVPLPFRAISRVEVDNKAEDELVLRRMALPAVNLSLYFDPHQPDFGIWTEDVRLERRRDSESSDVKILGNHFRSPLQVARARKPQTQNLLVRALSSILS